MELRQLRHFVALAETGGFTSAAARENIVQSGLSTSIQALERSLGSLLYVRGTRPVRLTDAGQALLDPARRVLGAADEARARVRETSEVLTGSLRVGVMQSAEYLVPLAAALSTFARTHPGVDIHLVQDAATAMIAMVEDGRINCAVVPALTRRPVGVRTIPLAGEPLRLAVRHDHPLADRPGLHLRDLAGEWFVEVHDGWAARALNDAAFARQGLSRRVVCEVNEWSLFLELVGAGAGVGFVPEGLPRPDTVVLRDVADHRPTRDIQLALPRGEELSAAARAFGLQLRETLDRADRP